MEESKEGEALRLPKTNKRPLHAHADVIQNWRLFKIRAIIRDLRPLFIHVLQTPDFKNCHASTQIRHQLKTLVQLCKPDVQEIKAASESEIPPTVALKKQLQEDGLSLGTYIVGGSAFDWNFITYLGNKAAYYGLTKEEFRAKKSLPSLASDI